MGVVVGGVCGVVCRQCMAFLLKEWGLGTCFQYLVLQLQIFKVAKAI